MKDTPHQKTADILIVDDMPANILLLERMLAARGYRARPVLSGKLALQAARAEPPDLILLDISMPEMDGYELCRQLKADTVLNEIPVIFMSARDETLDKVKAFRVGGGDYVTKPFQLEEVYARIETHLKLRSLQVRLQSFNLRLEERVEEEIRKSREKDLMVMRQEKLASLGQLAAGMAHEINNPVSFASCNISEFADYFSQLKTYLALQQEILAQTATPEQHRHLAEAAQRLEIPNILADGASLIAESLDGMERVARIVRDLKSFSRVDRQEYEQADLTVCLESALTIVSNELKYVAVVIKELQPLPPILCHPGQLTQVFLNLLTNAGHAVTGISSGRITLKSHHDDDFVTVSVADNGHGIPDELKIRIFEAFFTTKEVGQGTGLGLSISHDIINKHHGELIMESAVGIGTTFTVILPRTMETSC
jgi:two-component system, NtrC family, sensor kinase